MMGQRTVTGKITDAENGDPLIGANVLVDGTSTGTVSGIDGSYSLELPDGAKALRFSYTGYTGQVIDIGASNVIDVALTAGSLLNEVVVIGYGTVEKADATGSIQSVNSEAFNRGSITGAQELLAGKIAGVQITPSADPGGGAQIRIRGGSSLSASNDPLIVIDGVPVDNGGISGSRNMLNFINPADIETFTVLKDASATAIYGSRASNGVILITTKKGKLGKKISVEYNGNVSFSDILQTVDVLNAGEFRTLIEQRFPEGDTARALLGSANTDWQGQIYQTGVGTDHSLSFSGGVGPVPYRVSAGYTDKKGILKRDQFQRKTATINLSPGLLDNRLQLNVNLKAMSTDNFFANRGAIGAATAFDPTQPVFDEGNAYGGYFTWLQSNGNGKPNTLAPDNPVAMLEQRDDQSTVRRYVANGSVDYRFGFLPELRANLNLGYDYSKGEGTVNVPENAAFSYDELVGGGEDNTYSQVKKNELLEFYLNYVKDFSNSKLDIMGGYSWQHFYARDTFSRANVNRTEIVQGDGKGELYLLSLFGRLNYTLADRYLFTFTLRRDGTSRFSPDSRWGLFPAAAFAVKIVDDNKAASLSNLKLRLGWGVTGQQDVGGYYLYLPRYLTSYDNARYQFGSDFYTTLRPEGYDANIKWEETATYNAGLDYGFFDDRIYGSIEYYQRKTSDLINYIPVPAGTNLTNFISTNIGDLENKGVEFSINATPVKKEKFTWDLGFNFTANDNKITKLTASEDSTYQGVLIGGISGAVGNTIQIHSVGFPANSYYVYEQVYDANGVPIEDLYVDRNGDGVINNLDLYRYKKPAPDYFLGFTSNLSLGDFEFSFAGRANIGNYAYNNIQSNGGTYSSLYHSSNFLVNANRIATFLDFENPQYFSDYFIQNASFLRIDHVTLGYNFGSKIANIDFLKVYATIQNPILVTDYKGLDPEIAGGIDSNQYPRSRTFLFGVSARF
ncbi:MAG: SusC/RagA family TonB-linked outer membrane protein [Saprospiraceae bacterium]|nr:MAG: SusC/RagA family TonB-linked outer membrane protein [Saprospiraceae bacterium]